MPLWKKSREKNDEHYLTFSRDQLPATVKFETEPCFVHIYHHRVRYPREALDCWTYVSEGLWMKGQKDMILTLRCRPEEIEGDTFKIPKKPALFMRDVYRLAAQGSTVNLGRYSEFHEAGALGGSFKGLIYVAPSFHSGVTLPMYGALAGVLLYEDELEVVKLCGIGRIAAQLDDL